MSRETPHNLDLSHLTDAELVQQIGDLQATVNAMLAEISRRLGDQNPQTSKPPDAAQESADKNKLWGGIIPQDKDGRMIE